MSKAIALLRAGVSEEWADHRQPFHGDLPTYAETRTQELKALGFRRIVVRQLFDSLEVVLWREDGVIGEVIDDPSLPAGWPTLIVQLVTPLHGVVGELCTATACPVPDLWEGEIGQVFPGASPAELVARHGDATHFLEGLGIRTRVIASSEAPDYVVWASRTGWQAVSRATDQAIASELRRLAARKHSSVGPIDANPLALARIEALLETQRTGPSPEETPEPEA